MGGAGRWLILLAAVPGAVGAQNIENRVAAAPDGPVRMSFAAKPGVRGDGLNSFTRDQQSKEWESGCAAARVHVALEVRGHRVTGVRTYVGGRWRPDDSATDLGQVAAREAAAYLIRLAARPGELDGDPVVPATLADSVTIWPSLLRLARNSALPVERRRSAVFWLGQAAGAAAGAALDSVANDSLSDRELRKQAVFALSQRPASEGVPMLVRIARTNPDPELRKTALFWLSQSEDPRALDVFEEILKD